jgi:16S rRNA G966 N2-methylase RsmD
MQGKRASCVFTDPPYGVSIGKKNVMLNSVQKAGRCLDNIASDDLTPDQLKAILLPAFVNVREIVMADDCTLFTCSPQGGGLGMMMMMMMQEAGLMSRHVLIWKKNQPTFSMGRLDYDYAHEPILLTWGKRHKRPMGGAHRTSVWEIDKPRASAEHPTMKPVELYINAYLNNSDAGDLVADVFAGSGTAFIAAEQTGRICRGLEISPTYCDVIVKRWETFSGKTAVQNV